MSGFDNEVVYASNVDFSGAPTVNPTMTLDGQLLIASTLPNTHGTHINVGVLSLANTTLSTAFSTPNLQINFGLSNLLLGSPGSSIFGALRNVSVGALALASLSTGNSNSSFGYNTCNALTTGSNNSAFGGFSQQLLTTGSQNTSIGFNVFPALLTGSNNIAVGYQSGTNYVSSESSNLLINNVGTAAESNVLRIGTDGSSAGQQNKAFIAGIQGSTVAGSLVNVASTGQLAAIAAGTTGQVLASNGPGVSPSFQTSSAFIVPLYDGVGNDGTVTFDGSSVVLGLTPSAGAYTLTRDLNLGSSTINSGVVINTAGMRILCNGTLTNNGTIQNNGTVGVVGGNGGAGASAGSIGGASNGGNGATGAGVQGSNITNSLGGTGAAGGAGGSAGGIQRVPTAPAQPYLNLMGLTTGYFGNATFSALSAGAGGGGGGGDAVNKGGGGGGGGGVILIVSHLIAGTGSIQALGGNGGNGAVAGTNCGGGGGGGGGLVIVISNSVSAGAVAGQTITVAGGTHGTATGTGVNGSDGGTGTTLIYQG